jgi:hypothetical protein
MQREEDKPDENLRLYVCNTFLDVRDEDREALKVQMRRSASDSDLESKSSRASDEYPNPLPLVPDGQASGRASPIALNSAGRGQAHRQSGNASHNGDEFLAHVVWNNLSSPSVSEHPDSSNASDSQDCNKQEAGTSFAMGLERSPSWSVGAAKHEEGSCMPCAWHYQESGCSNRQSCEFCHMCPKDSYRFKRNKGRYKKKEQKLAAASAAAAARADSQARPVALQPGPVPGSSTGTGPSQLVAAAALANAPAVLVGLQPGWLPGTATGTYPEPPQHRTSGRSANGYLPSKFSM